MTFDHIESLAVAMNCAACGKYADAGMHQGADGKWRHPHCCTWPACVAKYRPAVPLPDREVETLAGEQSTLFGGGDTLREKGGGA